MTAVLQKGIPLNPFVNTQANGFAGLCSFMVLCALGACGGEKTENEMANAGTHQVGAHSPVSGGTAVIAIDSDPDVLNPLLFSSSMAGMVYAEIHDGLTEMDEELNYVPRIATSWDISHDHLSITYHLQPWFFSDGHPLTVFDVLRSYELFVDPVIASPNRGSLREISRAVVLDSSTIRYEFRRPQAEPTARSWHHILPLHIIERLATTDVASWSINSQPLSSGEFRLASWERNRSLVLVPNENYPGPKIGRAHV